MCRISLKECAILGDSWFQRHKSRRSSKEKHLHSTFNSSKAAITMAQLAIAATMVHAMLFCIQFSNRTMYINTLNLWQRFKLQQKKDKMKNQMEVKRRTKNKLRIQLLFNIRNDEENWRDVLFKLLDKYWMGACCCVCMCKWEFVCELSALFIFSFNAPFLNLTTTVATLSSSFTKFH